MKKKYPDPQTAEEWQACLDAAEFFLAMDSAKMYGLLTGGPKVDVDRCVQLLERGKALGYRPAPIEELCKRFVG